MGKAKSFSDQIRAAIDAASLSRYAICKATGFDQGSMSRFMRGDGISTDMLDRLADLLGLMVTARVEKLRREDETRRPAPRREIDREDVRASRRTNRKKTLEKQSDLPCGDS